MGESRAGDVGRERELYEAVRSALKEVRNSGTSVPFDSFVKCAE